MPPFDPQSVVSEYASLLKDYKIYSVVGDAYSASWCELAFTKAGIKYIRSEMNKSQLYIEALPLFMRQAISIPNHPKLLRELRLLERPSSVSPTHGAQENSVWNGHYACTCYHPLFVFNQFGDLERCALRPGNVHSADGWDAVLKSVVARYQGKVSRIYFRADAAFANPEVYEFLEAQRIKYAIRLPANQVLQDRISYLLTRPVGRPPNEVRRFHANFSYQAGSWTKPRRVIAKVEWHPGELYPRVGFIVTNMTRRPNALLPSTTSAEHASSGLGKAKARSSGRGCRAERSPPTRCGSSFTRSLTISAISCARWRPPASIKDWSLTSLKDKLIKIGAKVVSHGRYITFQMAEVAIPRRMFQEILRMIAELRPQPPPAPA